MSTISTGKTFAFDRPYDGEESALITLSRFFVKPFVNTYRWFVSKERNRAAQIAATLGVSAAASFGVAWVESEYFYSPFNSTGIHNIPLNTNNLLFLTNGMLSSSWNPMYSLDSHQPMVIPVVVHTDKKSPITGNNIYFGVLVGKPNIVHAVGQGPTLAFQAQVISDPAEVKRIVGKQKEAFVRAEKNPSENPAGFVASYRTNNTWVAIANPKKIGDELWVDVEASIKETLYENNSSDVPGSVSAAINNADTILYSCNADGKYDFLTADNFANAFGGNLPEPKMSNTILNWAGHHPTGTLTPFLVGGAMITLALSAARKR